MTRRHLLVLLLLLVALTSQADRRRKKTVVSQPDVIPHLSVSKELSGDIVQDTLRTDLEDQDEATQSFVFGGLGLHNTVTQMDTTTWQGRLQRGLDSLCRNNIFQTTQLGLYVYDMTDRRELFAVNHRQRMRPASCEKVITAISALNFLGGRYETHTDMRISGTVDDNKVLHGDVFVVGMMDPVLAQGDVYRMAMALQNEGIDSITGRIFIDATFKDDKEYGWGWCWDDDYGPLNVLTIDGKNVFERDFMDYVRSLGIMVSNQEITKQQCPTEARTIYSVAHTIDQILTRMMKNSNNIYAESLFYQLAGHSGQKGAGRKEAVKYVNEVIRKVGLNPKNYQIADGSGLSLYNYVSPELLVRFLDYAWTNEGIRSHFYPSLPVAGSDGTLSKRMHGTKAHGNVHAKTGTVEGISSLSGYATTTEGHVLAFSIINQGVISSSTGKAFQDKVCQMLCE